MLPFKKLDISENCGIQPSLNRKKYTHQISLSYLPGRYQIPGDRFPKYFGNFQANRLGKL